MDKLLETIRQIIERNSPEKINLLMEQMKFRASCGKIYGVTPEMIDEAYILVSQEKSFDNLPDETLKLFVEAEEFLDAYSILNEDTAITLKESEIFNHSDVEKHKTLNEDSFIVDLLGGNYGILN